MRFFKIPALPRDLLLLTVTMIIANIGSAMYFPLLPLYLESLGAGVQDVGLFFTVQVVLALCFRILGGWVSDHAGRLPTVAFGSVMGLMGFICLTLAPTWQWVILAALFGEIGVSLVGPSFQAFTAEMAPEGQTSSVFGLVGGLFTICMIVGPLFGGLLVELFGYKVMLATATAIFATATVLRLSLARGRPVSLQGLNPGGLVRDVRVVLAIIFSGGLLFWLFIVDGFLDTGLQIVLPFLPIYMTQIGQMGPGAYTVLFALMSLVHAAASLPGGLLADRYGEGRTIALGTLVLVATWLLLVTGATGMGVFALGFALAGVAQALVGPAFSSLVSKSVPRESLGMTWGVFMTALGVAAIPAPYIGGLLYDNIAPQAPMIAAVVMLLISIPLALVKLRVPAKAAPAPEPVETGVVLQTGD